MQKYRLRFSGFSHFEEKLNENCKKQPKGRLPCDLSCAGNKADLVAGYVTNNARNDSKILLLTTSGRHLFTFAHMGVEKIACNSGATCHAEAITIQEKQPLKQAYNELD